MATGGASTGSFINRYVSFGGPLVRLSIFIVNVFKSAANDRKRKVNGIPGRQEGGYFLYSDDKKFEG